MSKLYKDGKIQDKKNDHLTLGEIVKRALNDDPNMLKDSDDKKARTKSK